MKNRGYILKAKNNIALIEYDLGPPDENSVLVEFLYCSICGGDYSQYIGRRNNYPISLGHEFIARIISCGAQVKSFNIGDYVTTDFNYRCGMCSYCNKGKSHLCIDNDKQVFSNRAFFQYGTIDTTYLYKIQPVLPLFVYTLIEPFSCVLHALESYDFKKIDKILINGIGSIGMLATFYLCSILHKKVYINDSNTIKQENVVKKFHCHSFSEKINYDLIIEASNSTLGCKNIFRNAPNGQQLCVMTHLYGEDTSFIYEMLCKKELQAIFPLRNGEPKNMQLAMDYLDIHWNDSFNDLLSIYDFDNLPFVFANKVRDHANKQIIRNV